MDLQKLENKIGFQLSFLIVSGKTGDQVIQDLKQIAIDYAEQFKKKADRYDILESKIAKCYVDENGEELSEEESENMDLGTIGEIAAGEFGWL